jgi:hypothetical protein
MKCWDVMAEIEHVVAATSAEAAQLNLPAGGIMLLA